VNAGFSNSSAVNAWICVIFSKVFCHNLAMPDLVILAR
jgi:hypothetical protein